MQADERDGFLERWLAEVVATPGLTGIRDPAQARATLLDDALRVLPLLTRTTGDIVDVGSGGGSPGVPLAASLPHREFVLLDAELRKCEFVGRATAELPNVRVVRGRAEEQPLESFGVALAKALAKPPVAAELCLPLVALDGTVLLWVGPSADHGHVSRVARTLGGELEDEPLDGVLRLRKTAPTPARFPRRPGMAKKRPLA